MNIQDMKVKLDEIYEEIQFKYYMASPGQEVMAELFQYPYALFSTDLILNKSGFSEPVLRRVDLYNHVMLDSGIFNPEITNADILRVAERVQPKVIVPKDYFFDNPRTIESVKKFAKEFGSYNLKNSRILIPLQKPWTIDHTFRNHDYFAIGGIIKLSGPAKRKVIAKIVTKHPDKEFHLFGAGLKAFKDLIYKHKNIISSDTNMERKASINRCRVFKTNGKYFTICSDLYVAVSFLDELLAYYNFRVKPEQSGSQTTLF